MNDSPESSPPADALMDIKTVAARLGVCCKTVRRKIARGELASHKVGKLIRVSERDYADYVARARQHGRWVR